MTELDESFPLSEANCKNCIFWSVYYFDDLSEWNGDLVHLYKSGACKRYPPKISLSSSNEEFIARHPETTFYDWCGEFKFNPKAKIGYCINTPNAENINHFDYTHGSEPRTKE